MVKKDKPTKREHWLPVASHLNQFSHNDVVQVYYFQGSKRDFTTSAKHFKSSPNGIGLEKDLYERPDLPVNTVENNLAKIEADFGEVLENKIKKQKDITENDRLVIAQYLSLLQHRTPRQRDHLHSFLDDIAEKGRQLALAHGNPGAGDKFVKEVEESKKQIFTDAMAIAQDVDHWKPLDYCFLIIDDDIFPNAEFITGDHPVSLIDFTDANGFYGLHPWGKTSENVVPLTPKVAIFGNRVGITGYRKIDINVVREVNQRTLRESRKMIISKGEITDEEENIVNHFPQSLLLEFIDLPEGRMDAILKEIENKKLDNR